ncbi:MAG: hypothetical protein R3E39_12235 [Anaerolineae bacterium]
MEKTLKKMVLNRAVFSKRPFDSGALTVLGTLFHRFPEVGDYEVFVSRDGQNVHRTRVQVVSDNAPSQLNFEMSSASNLAEGCGCGSDNTLTLKAGGVVSFYASQGVGAYSVSVSQSDDRNKRKVTHLDSTGYLPAGDLFAVTLVHAGTYSVTATAGKARFVGEIRVGAPGGEKYRPDRPTVVELGKDGFTPKSAQIMAGQSVVFNLTQAARIQVELAKPERPGGSDKVRQTYTINRRRPVVEKPASPTKERDDSGDKGRGKGKGRRGDR